MSRKGGGGGWKEPRAATEIALAASNGRDRRLGNLTWGTCQATSGRLETRSSVCLTAPRSSTASNETLVQLRLSDMTNPTANGITMRGRSNVARMIA